MNILIEDGGGLNLEEVKSYGDVFLNGDEYDQLKKFILKGSGAIGVVDTEEIKTLKAIIDQMQQTLEKLRLDHQRELENITQRLRAAHMIDLRTHMKTMDHLVNLTSSRNLSPLKD